MQTGIVRIYERISEMYTKYVKYFILHFHVKYVIYKYL
jgi:hypothetical protein